MSSEKDKYKLPEWIGCPPKGTHLDVTKGPKLIQKLLIDEKGYYYFGRNPTDCDFVCEHASCSRVHALLLFHKLIKRVAIVDLESSHGTFVNNIRISSLSPVFLDPDQCFHFGASTRRYFLREKLINRDADNGEDDVEIETGFSANQSELDTVTESNTAQNRRIPLIPQTTDDARRKLRPRPRLQFNEEEEIINPEDVDPLVGRFRNMVRTAVIPTSGRKREAVDDENELFDFYLPSQQTKKTRKIASPATTTKSGDKMFSIGSLSLNAAPDLDLYSPILPPPKNSSAVNTPAAKGKYGPLMPSKDASKLLGFATPDSEVCPKKKYAKEAWPLETRPRSHSGVI
uniref:FHA domain-containing protein n=1 Tax=Meloidogyne incognita TaxID=6306 RepID=A0A914L8R7_MELIC